MRIELPPHCLRGLLTCPLSHNDNGDEIDSNGEKDDVEEVGGLSSVKGPFVTKIGGILKMEKFHWSIAIILNQ